jgi:tetrahydromethanopterin S-methyltransferase subunit B
MKFVLSESEKESILSLYGIKTKTSQKSIIDEKVRMRVLMNLHEGINPGKLFDEVPVLKPLSKTMGELTTTVDDFVKNLGDYSGKLRSEGIGSLDDLISKAREFQEANKSKYGELVDDALLVQRYLIDSGALREIEESLITKNLDAIERKTFEAFDLMNDELRSLNNSLDNGDVIGSSLDISSKDLTSLQNSSTKLEEATKKIDDAITKIDDEINNIPSNPNNRTRSEDLLFIRLSNIRKSLNKFKTAISKQKNAVDGAVEQLESRSARENSGKIEWQGKTFDAANLTPLQRKLFSISADKLPSFVSLVLRFIIKLSKFGKVELLQTELAKNIAKLKQLQISLRSYNTVDITKEINLYTRETATLIENIKGKVLDYTNVKEGNLWNYFVQMGKGATGFNVVQKTELDDIWKEITSMLQNEVTKKHMTQEEMVNILEGIKTVYAKTDANGNVVGVDGTLLGGPLVFREDLQTMSKSVDMELNTSLNQTNPNAVNYIVKDSDLSSKLGDMVDSLFKQLTGFSTKEFWKGMFKSFAKVAVREALFGLPFNLRKYLTPLTRTGVNIKGIAQTIINFSLAKAIGTFIFGGIGACLEWSALQLTMGFTGLERDEVYDMSIGEWNEETKKYKDLDVTSILGDIINSESSEETKTNKASNLEYYSKVKREYGPLEIKIWENIVQVSSILSARPTQSEWLVYEEKKKNEMVQKMKENTEKEVVKYEQSFYALPLEEQKNIAGMIADNFTIMIENGNYDASGLDKSTRDKILKRYFIRADFNGIPLSDTKNVEELKNTYLTATNYRGFPCVCKSELSYEVDYLDFKGEKKEIKKPKCNDYVRILEYDKLIFMDSKNLQGVSGNEGKYGYLTGASAKSNQQYSTDWHKLIEIKNELK